MGGALPGLSSHYHYNKRREKSPGEKASRNRQRDVPKTRDAARVNRLAPRPAAINLKKTQKGLEIGSGM